MAFLLPPLAALPFIDSAFDSSNNPVAKGEPGPPAATPVARWSAAHRCQKTALPSTIKRRDHPAVDGVTVAYEEENVRDGE